MTILGVKVDLVTVSTPHHTIADLIWSNQKDLVLNVNSHCLNLCYGDHVLHRFLNSACLVFCDGAGVMLAARILGYCIPQRITYADWIWALAAFAEPRGFTFFFLGARPGVADKAAARLKGRFLNLRIVGTHHGFFDKTLDSDENESVICRINRSKRL